MKNISIDDNILKLLEKSGKIEKFTPGTFIFKEGDDAGSVYVLKNGTLEILKQDDAGSLYVINTISDISIFGEMAVFLENKRSASVRAKTPVEVIAFSKNTFLQAASKIPKFNFSVMSSLIERLNEINNKYANALEYKLISTICFYLIDTFVNKKIKNIGIHLKKLTEMMHLDQPEILKALFVLEKEEVIYTLDTDKIPEITFKLDEEKMYSFLRKSLYRKQ
ncbi:cyclic nucleotide-binding domain-containing protein [Deferribacteraceae bacterium V6Fe1]|nr:cyclic nucleotide-binding domain-containing protein [Deferribacteraceae bacterium V6Fe1]